MKTGLECLALVLAATVVITIFDGWRAGRWTRGELGLMIGLGVVALVCAWALGAGTFLAPTDGG